MSDEEFFIEVRLCKKTNELDQFKDILISPHFLVKNHEALPALTTFFLDAVDEYIALSEGR